MTLVRRYLNIVYAGGYAYGVYLADILEWSPASEEWTKLGNLKKGRVFHAVSVVMMEDVEDYCVAGRCHGDGVGVIELFHCQDPEPELARTGGDKSYHGSWRMELQ